MTPAIYARQMTAAETLEKWRAFKRRLRGRSHAAHRAFEEAAVHLVDPATLDVQPGPEWREELARPEVQAWLSRIARQVGARIG
jgi:hypothetical protein